MIKLIFITFLLLVVLSTSYLYYFSYEEIMHRILEYFDKLDKINEFKSLYLTPLRFGRIRIGSALLLILTVFLFIIRNRLLDVVVGALVLFFLSFVFFFKKIGNSYSRINKLGFWLVFFCILFCKVYFMNRYFFHIDELTSYLFFVKRGFWVTITYYPNPNNHILFSLLTVFFNIFIESPYYLMKVPSLMVSMATFVVLVLYLRKYFSSAYALLGGCILAFSEHYFLYSIFGRGYLLMTFFVLVSVICSLELLATSQTKQYWVGYILSSVLGFYSMLVFAYPFLSLLVAHTSVALFTSRSYSLKKVLISNGLIFLGVGILYAPVIAISGFDSLVSNSWIVKVPMEEFIFELPNHINQAFGYCLNSSYGFGIGFLLVMTTSYILVKSNQTKIVLVLLCLLTVPWVVLMLQHIRPYERIWTYLIFPLSICWLICIHTLIHLIIKNEKWRNGLAWCSILYIFIFSSWHFYAGVKGGHGIYNNITRISSYVVRDAKTGVFTDENSYSLYIRYIASEQGRSLVPDLYLSDKKKVYDFVLLTPVSKFPEGMDVINYTIVEKDDYIVVYKLKN